MTISVEESRSTLITHDGTTALYNYTFQEPKSANVAVYIKQPDPEQEVKLVPTTEYTVAVDSDSVGGSITLVSPTDYVNLSVIRIARETPPIQASRFSNAGSAYPETFEDGLDLLTRQIQELNTLVSFSLGVKQTQDTHFDARGELIKNLLTPVDANDAATKSWVESVLLTNPAATAFATARLQEDSASLWLDALTFTTFTKGLITAATRDDLIDAHGYSAMITNILKDTDPADVLIELGFSSYMAGLVARSTFTNWIDTAGFSNLVEGILKASVPSVILDDLGFSAYMQGLVANTTLLNWIDTAGFSNLVGGILKTSTVSAILDDLNVSTFMQTLLDDTTAADARATLAVTEDIAVYQPSIIPNADMQIWQNGVAFVTPSDETYTADQFIILRETAASVNVDQGEAFPAGARGSIEVKSVIANTKWAMLTVLDNQRTHPLRGTKVSLSISMKNGTSDAQDEVKIFLISWNGTLDDPTISPISSWGSPPVAPTLVSNWTYFPTPTVAVLTDSFQTFVVVDQDVPSDCNNLGIMIVTVSTSIDVDDVVTHSEWNLVHGAKAKLFASRSREEELLACQRFFAKTFPYEVVPVQGIGNTIGTLAVRSQNTGSFMKEWRYPVEMLRDPTIITYNPEVANNAWREFGGSVNVTVGIEDKDRHRALIESTSTPVIDKTYIIHASAIARF